MGRNDYTNRGWLVGWLGLLVCWLVGWLVAWFVGLLVCWFVGLLVCWFVVGVVVVVVAVVVVVGLLNYCLATSLHAFLIYKFVPPILGLLPDLPTLHIPYSLCSC